MTENITFRGEIVCNRSGVDGVYQDVGELRALIFL
jgi:hypothetical protein